MTEGMVSIDIFPLLVIAGGLALFVYAILTELSGSLIGRSHTPVDSSSVRDIARRMCLGNSLTPLNIATFLWSSLAQGVRITPAGDT
jgi:hypothetical protein